MLGSCCQVHGSRAIREHQVGVSATAQQLRHDTAIRGSEWTTILASLPGPPAPSPALTAAPPPAALPAASTPSLSLRPYCPVPYPCGSVCQFQIFRGTPVRTRCPASWLGCPHPRALQVTQLGVLHAALACTSVLESFSASLPGLGPLVALRRDLELPIRAHGVGGGGDEVRLVCHYLISKREMRTHPSGGGGATTGGTGGDCSGTLCGRGLR